MQTKLQQIADALNGAPEKTPSSCHVVPPSGVPDVPRFRPFDIPQAGNTYYADYNNGNDNNAGTQQSPFKTIERAIAASRATPGQNTIILRAGTFYQTGSILLDGKDSGLTFQAYPGEPAHKLR